MEKNLRDPDSLRLSKVPGSLRGLKESETAGPRECGLGTTVVDDDGLTGEGGFELS